MFENMTEGQARREILEAVAEYAKKSFMSRRKNSMRATGFPTRPGSMTMRKW